MVAQSDTTLPEPVTKPLEWVKDPERTEEFPKWRAETPLEKTYDVTKVWWGKEDVWAYICTDGADMFYRTPEEAFAAAQADFEARIRSALSHPAALSGGGSGVVASQAGAEAKRESKHEDIIERLNEVFYIRWTSGPDYERAFLCVEDGEPDMNSFAATSFGCARIFRAGMQALAALAHPAALSGGDSGAVKALAEALRESDSWVMAALQCKDWHWDDDQRDAAEMSVKQAHAALAALATAPEGRENQL